MGQLMVFFGISCDRMTSNRSFYVKKSFFLRKIMGSHYVLTSVLGSAW